MAEDDQDKKPASAASLGWEGFAADPRVPENATYRASDADRHHAFELLAEAYSDGRLNHEEYEHRLDLSLTASTLGDFPPLVTDLLLPKRRFLPANSVAAPDRVAEANRHVRQSWMGWIGLAMLFNLIWLATVLGSGTLFYWWPFWPMLGTAIPTFIAAQAARARALRPDPQPLYPPGQVPRAMIPPPVLRPPVLRPPLSGSPHQMHGFTAGLPRMMPPPGLTAEQRMRWLRQRQMEQERRRSQYED